MPVNIFVKEQCNLIVFFRNEIEFLGDDQISLVLKVKICIFAMSMYNIFMCEYYLKAQS